MLPILSIFQAYISLSPTATLHLINPILQLMLTWIHLDFSSTSPLLSLLPLTTSFRPLWLFLLSLLNSPHTDTVTLASDLLVGLLGNFPSSLEIASYLPPSQDTIQVQFNEEAVVLEVIRAVLDAWDALPELATSSSEGRGIFFITARAKALCSVVQSLADTCPEGFVDPGAAEGMAAAEMVLAAAGDLGISRDLALPGVGRGTGTALGAGLGASGAGSSPGLGSAADVKVDAGSGGRGSSNLPAAAAAAVVAGAVSEVGRGWGEGEEGVGELEALGGLAVDFFVAVNIVPTAQRSEPFRGALQLRLGHALMRLVSGRMLHGVFVA